MNQIIFTPKTSRPGFSLILSLTLMAMLLILCVGAAAMLSVELRVAQASSSMMRARLNALASARIALGELQRLAGPDRRITANAAILGGDALSSGGVGRPRTLGVWMGLTQKAGTPANWSSSNLPAVSPVAGSYEDDHRNAFAGWLSSGRIGADTGSAELTFSGATMGLDWMKSGASAPDTSRDWLLLSGGGEYPGAFPDNDARDLYASPENFADASGASLGRFAWTVMDENQKARVDLRDDPGHDKLSPAERAVLLAGAARRFHPGYERDATGKWRSQIAPTDTRTTFGGWTLFDLETESDKGWFPLETAGAVTPAKALRHDFTTASVSLLTDTANGGLRRDINMLPLMSDTDFDSARGLGFDDGNPGYIGFESDNPADITGRSAWWRTVKTKGIRHPYANADKDLVAASWPIWSDVREWSKFPTTATVDGTGLMNAADGSITQQPLSDYNTWSASVAGAVVTPPDRTKQASWRQPVLYRYRQEISLRAISDTDPGNSSKTLGTYSILPDINVVVQLWNPYNVPMKLDGTGMNFSMLCAPYLIRLTQSGVTKTIDLAQSTASGSNLGVRPVLVTLKPQGVTLAPGEIRTWSVAQLVPANNNNGSASLISLLPGYYPSGGLKIPSTYIDGYTSTNPNPTGGFDGTRPVNAEIRLRNHSSNSKEMLNLMICPPTNTNIGRVIGAAHEAGYGSNEGPDQNPARILGNPDTVSASPLALAVAPQRIATFEFRAKAEAKSGANTAYTLYTGGSPGSTATATYADNQRYSFGEPVGLWHRYILSDGKIGSWFAASDEAVIWGANQNDPENREALADDNGKGLGGTGYDDATGVPNFIRRHFPLHPPTSLLALSHARLGGDVRPVFRTSSQNLADDTNAALFAPYRAFGNSLISPYVPTTEVTAGTATRPMPGTWLWAKSTGANFTATTPVDMSWVMNSAIADSWFCSSLGAWDQGVTKTLFPSIGKTAGALFKDFLSGQNRLPDASLAPDPFTANDDTLLPSGDKASADSYKKIAAHLLREGGFNINSTSVRAWRAFLAASHADTSGVSSPTGVAENKSGSISSVGKIPGTATFPVAGVANADLIASSAIAQDEISNTERVDGGRILSDAELDKLAVAMVSEVKRRGPFLSVGEFLNRRLESGALGRMGAVQSAIEATGLNDKLKDTGRTMQDPDLSDINTDLATVYKYSGVGQPGWFSQADLLAAIGSRITPRGDTFVIRATGSAGDDDSVRATVELTVRRTYQYVDRTETESVEYADLQKAANRAFGRRFAPVVVKWLSKEEI